MFTIEEIEELGIGQLGKGELERALAAFNGFVQPFEKNWVLVTAKVPDTFRRGDRGRDTKVEGNRLQGPAVFAA